MSPEMGLFSALCAVAFIFLPITLVPLAFRARRTNNLWLERLRKDLNHWQGELSRLLEKPQSPRELIKLVEKSISTTEAGIRYRTKDSKEMAGLAWWSIFFTVCFAFIAWLTL